MKTRIHECWECKHKWRAPVILTTDARNLSGERTEYCPGCGGPAACASPYQEYDGMTTPGLRQAQDALELIKFRADEALNLSGTADTNRKAELLTEYYALRNALRDILEIINVAGCY